MLKIPVDHWSRCWLEVTCNRFWRNITRWPANFHLVVSDIWGYCIISTSHNPKILNKTRSQKYSTKQTAYILGLINSRGEEVVSRTFLSWGLDTAAITWNSSSDAMHNTNMPYSLLKWTSIENSNLGRPRWTTVHEESLGTQSKLWDQDRAWPQTGILK